MAPASKYLCLASVLGWLLLLPLFLPSAVGWKFGAPTNACFDMMPRHERIKENTPKCPYKLELQDEATTYIPGETLTVCVTGSLFQGFLLQARVVGGTLPVGTFQENLPNNTQLMKCSSDNDSVTHSNVVTKADHTCFKWKAPSDDLGDLRFV
ncbi:hypothetical protein NP493_5g15052 [Ridgeia piscesae]|uniref:Reelin domain-containing protein n=1 Tax=Ridgeia piscesae TaxID=27915 RepID=A0AAD9ULG3_RIDPI|nr:hypothetical protein NP493_5g15052 [Ridgeia piscesae]